MAIPLLIAAGVVAAAGIAGAIAKANAEAEAAKEQTNSANKAMDQQKEMWQQQRADQAPWLQAGQQSLAQLMAQMNKPFDPSMVANDPGYQFRLAEGQKALERSAAARGGLNSGAFMKGLDRYSQGLASDEYQNAWGRNQAGLNRLAQLAGVGQASAQNLGALGSQNATNMNQLYAALGNAAAAGKIAQGDAWTGSFDAVGRGASMYAGGGFGASMGGGGGYGGYGSYGAYGYPGVMQHPIPQQQSQVPYYLARE
jgi:hypothetical protein